MEFGTYTASAADLAADLVNACPPGGFTSGPDPLRALDLPWTPAQLARVSELAQQLRRVFVARDDEQATDAINDLLMPLPVAAHLSTHDGKAAHMHYAPPDADALTRVACNTAMALATITSEHGQHRLGVCGADDCDTVFVDTSRNGRRRFCGHACANRTHVASHRHRTATA